MSPINAKHFVDAELPPAQRAIIPPALRAEDGRNSFRKIYQFVNRRRAGAVSHFEIGGGQGGILTGRHSHANMGGMTEPRPRRPRDPNQLAKRIVDLATGEAEEPDSLDHPADPTKNQHAVELGRLGGKKGGAARAKALSPEQRSEIAKRAAARRWGRDMP